MRGIIWTRAARQDFRDVIAYIAADNRTAAASVGAQIDKTAQSLSHFATGRRGRVAGTYERLVTGLPYFLVYRIRKLDNTDTIRILRVVHTARQWPPE